MRIDLNYGPQQIQESDRSSAQTTTAAGAAASNPLGEDQAQLSGAHVQVAALAAQASHLPEVREERVQALRQAIQSGHYQVSPEKVASALMVQMVGQPTG
ncbi:MAG TPA: flagellar biosynthesis anti-sigma factor FlgM [Candidatus Acidoferrales bacterium]|nr:flagellar biosynthesis anti-sigma factor FlgM [Candidatus Acidoferrales bacterium]